MNKDQAVVLWNDLIRYNIGPGASNLTPFGFIAYMSTGSLYFLTGGAGDDVAREKAAKLLRGWADALCEDDKR